MDVDQLIKNNVYRSHNTAENSPNDMEKSTELV